MYDFRLTREYFETLRLSAEIISRKIKGFDGKFRVLDVGAGTGQFMRQFHDDEKIDWTCIEPSHEMATILRKLFGGKPKFPAIHECSFQECASYVQAPMFDAVVFNSVLS